jgi:transcriptional regulator with XRE-family HTH domain
VTTSDMVARRVREVRRRRGLSVAQLAQRCADVGVPELTAQALYNLEAGRADKRGRRRRAVTVDELLVLALALDVAPVHLLVPLDDDEVAYPVTPTRGEPAGEIRDWVRGAAALDGTDQRSFFSEVPEHEWQQVTERTHVHRGGQLDTVRERRLAELLAVRPDLAALMEADRRTAEETLARLRHQKEGRQDG